MTETVAYIRNSLKDIYPPGEAQALVRLIMERVCGLSTHQLLLGRGSGGGYITRSARRGRGERPYESSFRILP